MSKKDKYDVQKFTGIPVETDASGKYQLKFDQNGEVKLHTWRTGKHTKGKFNHPGQLMLTENNLTVVILKQNQWLLRIVIVKRRCNDF